MEKRRGTKEEETKEGEMEADRKKAEVKDD